MPGRPYLDFYSLVMQDYTFERVLDEVADGDTIAAIQRRVTARAEELFPGKMATFEHGPVFSRQMLYMWMDMKALGNGIVPLCALPFALAIADVLGLTHAD